MAQQTDIAIRVYRFFRKFVQKYDTVEWTHPQTGETEHRARKVHGQYDEIHMVEYGPLGSDKIIIEARVKDLMNIGDMSDAQRNPTILIAAARWEAIRPMYEQWLKGIEPTAEGVPLMAWSGMEQSLVEILRMRGIHTVQQLARLGDTHIQNFGIPGLRVYIDNAKTYIATLDNAAFIEQMNQKDLKIADLSDTVGELKRMVADLAAAQMEKNPAAVKQVLDLDSDPEFDAPDGFEDPTADAEPSFVGDVGEPRGIVETPSQHKKRTARA